MKRNRHEWTSRTQEGERRVFRASTERGEWVIHSAEDLGRSSRRGGGDLDSGTEWVLEDPPALEDLQRFREILWNKYRRGRVAYKYVEKLDALIEEVEKLQPVESNEDAGESASDAGAVELEGEEE